MRHRRTKADIEEDIRKAAIDQILKRGFSASLVTGIIKKAKIEPPVFYHRYKDLDEFYSEFVKGYDYWFSDIATKAIKANDDPKLQFISLIRGLQEVLNGKSVMQELLRWEIAELKQAAPQQQMQQASASPRRRPSLWWFPARQAAALIWRSVTTARV